MDFSDIFRKYWQWSKEQMSRKDLDIPRIKSQEAFVQAAYNAM